MDKHCKHCNSTSKERETPKRRREDQASAIATINDRAEGTPGLKETTPGATYKSEAQLPCHGKEDKDAQLAKLNKQIWALAKANDALIKTMQAQQAREEEKKTSGEQEKEDSTTSQGKTGHIL